jgi:polar amino acid transport system substrate-binding protein
MRKDHPAAGEIARPCRTFASQLMLAVCALWVGTADRALAALSPGKALRVGVAKNLPPMVFVEKGQRRGFEVDLAKGLAEHLGRPVEFVVRKEADLIPALLAGKIDIIMSGMTATRERAMRVNFTNPYLRSGQIPLVRVDNSDNIQFSLMWDKHKVGYQRGTTGESFVQRNLRKAVKVPFSNPADGAASLAKKKIDVFLHDAPVNWWLASTHEAEGLTVINAFLTAETLGWAVRKDDAELLNAANEYLETIRKDGRLTAAVLKWMGGYPLQPG